MIQKNDFVNNIEADTLKNESRKYLFFTFTTPLILLNFGVLQPNVFHPLMTGKISLDLNGLDHYYNTWYQYEVTVLKFI